MRRVEARIVALEVQAAQVRRQALLNDKLFALAATFPAGSDERLAALVELVCRPRSAAPFDGGPKLAVTTKNKPKIAPQKAHS